jgi:hypothetical protein
MYEQGSLCFMHSTIFKDLDGCVLKWMSGAIVLHFLHLLVVSHANLSLLF